MSKRKTKNRKNRRIRVNNRTKKKRRHSRQSKRTYKKKYTKNKIKNRTHNKRKNRSYFTKETKYKGDNLSIIGGNLISKLLRGGADGKPGHWLKKFLDKKAGEPGQAGNK